MVTSEKIPAMSFVALGSNQPKFGTPLNSAQANTINAYHISPPQISSSPSRNSASVNTQSLVYAGQIPTQSYVALAGMQRFNQPLTQSEATIVNKYTLSYPQPKQQNRFNDFIDSLGNSLGGFFSNVESGIIKPVTSGVNDVVGGVGSLAEDVGGAVGKGTSGFLGGLSLGAIAVIGLGAFILLKK